MPGSVYSVPATAWKDILHGDEGPRVYDTSVGWRAIVALYTMKVTGDGTPESPYVYTWKTIDASYVAPTEAPEAATLADGAPNWTVNITFASSSYWRRLSVVLASNGAGVFGPVWKAPGTTTHQFVGDISNEGQVVKGISWFSWASGGTPGPVSPDSNTVTLSELA